MKYTMFNYHPQNRYVGYVPTTLELYFWALRIFGKDNLPPEMEKISKDWDSYYKGINSKESNK